MISAVVLAAGASTRMGTQKLLLPFGGEPLVRRAVRQVCDAGFDDVLVVLGSEHEQDAGRARRTGDASRDQRAVRKRHGQLVPHGGRTSRRQRRRDVCARRSAVRHDATSTGRCSTPTAITAPAIVSVRYGEVMAPPHLFQREFFPELARAAARRAFAAAAAPRADHGPAVSAGPADRHRHARRLRARQEPSVVGVMKAADRSAEEPSVEAASNREDFPEDGDAPLPPASPRRARAPPGCARARGPTRRAGTPARQAGQQLVVARPRSEHADVRGVRVEREAQALPIALDVVVHHEREAAGTQRHGVGELAEMRARRASRRGKRSAVRYAARTSTTVTAKPSIRPARPAAPRRVQRRRSRARAAAR